MSDLVRKQIYIYPRQEALLKRLAKQLGLSEAEIIRQAIDREAQNAQPDLAKQDREPWESTLRLIAERKALGKTGEPYQFNRQELYDEREDRWQGSAAQDKP